MRSTATAASGTGSPANADGTLAHVDYLDGWRGMAILLVLQSHFFGVSGFDSGRLGVDVFFSLSGLLMARILFVQRTPLKQFYKRRIARIVPAFLIFLVLVYGIAYAAGDRRSGSEMLSTALFLRTYLPAVPDIWHTGLPVGHLWSLNVEEHCYLLLSLLTLFAFGRVGHATGLILLALCCCAMNLLYARNPAFAPSLPDIRTETAAAFLLLSAGYSLVCERWQHKVKGWMPALAFGLALACYTAAARWWMPMLLAPALLAFAVGHLVVLDGRLRRSLEAAPLRQIGVWSYSIYLWQQPFYQYRAQFPPGVALLCAIGAGLLSFHALERPVRGWLNRNW